MVTLRRKTSVGPARGDADLNADGEAAALGSAALGRWRGLEPIDWLLADGAITEIMIDGGGRVSVERGGAIEAVSHRLGAYEVELLIERILTPLGLRADRTAPIVDARLDDGSRVNIVVPPLAVDGPAIAIRRFPERPVRLTSFGPPEMVRILTGLVTERANVVVAGPTGSGKTTLIGALSRLVDSQERIVSIEDIAELQLSGVNVVRLETRPANSEGIGEVSLRRLVLNALRMRPDRLVVGEVRGAEAFDLLLALTSGHRGCLTSCHAADGPAALRRLETLAALAGVPIGPARIRQLIHDGVDAVVVTDRSGPRRQVISIDVLEDGRIRNRWRLRPELAVVA